MTLEELEEEPKPKNVTVRSCEICLPYEDAETSHHIILVEDEATGEVTYMTMTEDGRIVPLDTL